VANKKICVFLFDGFADWEISYATPHLQKCEKYDLATVTIAGQNVKSMGGLQINSNYKVADVDYENIAMFILPGGDAQFRITYQSPIGQLKICERRKSFL